MNKRVTIISIFFLLGIFKNHAQDTLIVTQFQIDSLQHLIQNHPANDIKKVELLNKYAQLCFYDLLYLQGILAMQNARKISNDIEYEYGDGHYYKSLGIFLRNTPLGLYYLLQSDLLLQTNIPRNLWHESSLPIRKKDSNYKIIEKRLIEAQNYFKKNEDVKFCANIEYALFRNALNDSINPKTKKYLNNALVNFQNLNLAYPQFLLLIQKLHILNSEENKEEAREIELKIIDLIDQTEDSEAKMLMSYELADQYFHALGGAHLALEYFLNSIDFLKKFEYHDLLFEMYNLPGVCYKVLGDHVTAVSYFKKFLELYEKIKAEIGNNFHESTIRHVGYVYINLGSSLVHLKQFEEAKHFLHLGKEIADQKNMPILKGRYFKNLALIDEKLNNKDGILQNRIKAFSEFQKNDIKNWASGEANLIAWLYFDKNDLETALHYAHQSFNLSSKNSGNYRHASFTLSRIYELLGQIQKSLDYLKLHQQSTEKFIEKSSKNTIANAEIKNVLENRKREIAVLEKETLLKEQKTKNQQLWIFSIAGALLSALFVAFILYRNNKTKQKANAQLKRQKAKVERTLDQLKATQAQLIQSEKMASLGELTAGIAHEIQNPLNFVNNFSEINKELVNELKEELEVGNSQLATEIANDIIENENKISHHGKRAEAIVKGMLQHSRTETGEKEPTDINALCNEYLRLSYHGLRAKDKSFNAEFKMEADKNLKKINVVPQDIGRVLLNLINNAFHAVDKKARSNTPQPPIGGAESSPNKYKPEVVVRTSSSKSPSGDSRLPDGQVGVNITVTDNGEGIPSEIKDKIFQPFFTTKPTGSGTGLGLSLSYDIVKAHGGEISVESRKNEGTTFTILIPVKS